MSNNTNEDILKFLGICVVVGVLVFYAIKFLKLQAKVLEGAANMSDSTSTTSSSANGIGGSAAQYNSTLKSEVVKMQDTLLLSKYRTEYENALLNLDDYLNLSMLKTALSIDLTSEFTPGKPNPNIALLTSLKTMGDAKASLNSTMKYIDSH
jgi:hypothetical protein